MPSFRLSQINSFVKEELGSIILKEIEFPFGGCLVTIVKVETAPDLKHAVVSVSILPIEKAKEVKSILNHQKGRLQKILNSRLRTKNTPRLHFKIDESEEKADQISRLLDTIKK